MWNTLFIPSINNNILIQCFKELKAPYTAIELDQREDMNDIQDVLQEITGSRTVIYLRLLTFSQVWTRI